MTVSRTTKMILSDIITTLNNTTVHNDYYESPAILADLLSAIQIAVMDPIIQDRA